MRPTLCIWLCFASCGGVNTNNTEDTGTGYSAALSVDAAVQESGLLAAIATKLTGSGGGMGAAADAATITDLFLPAGCATAQTNLNVVTYTFTNCTGPYGLLRLNGTITATFTPMLGSKVKVDLSAMKLKIATVTVDVAATAVVTTGVTQDSATVTSSSSALNARGETATHSGSYTAGWDATCLTLNGTFTTTIGSAAWTTVIANFHQCRNQCPDTGGTVTVTGSKGGSVTVHYSSGPSAEVTTTTAGGTNGMILLSCGAT